MMEKEVPTMRQIVMLLICALLLAGCSAKHPPTAPTPVIPDTLQVVRESNLNRMPALTATVTDAQLVAELYQTLHQLPPWPKDQALHCPLDLGVRYHLHFQTGEKPVAEAIANATGCRGITLNDGHALLTMNPIGNTFWSQFNRILGLSPDESSGFAYLPSTPRPAPSGFPPPMEAQARLIVRLQRAGQPATGASVRCAPYVPERGQPDQVLVTDSTGEFAFPVFTLPETVHCSVAGRELDLQASFTVQGQIIRRAAQIAADAR